MVTFTNIKLRFVATGFPQKGIKSYVPSNVQARTVLSFSWKFLFFGGEGGSYVFLNELFLDISFTLTCVYLRLRL